MIVKRYAEVQEFVDVDGRIPGRRFSKGEENKISTCLTSFKFQKNRMQV